MKRKMFSSAAAIAMIAGSLLSGCGGGGDDGGIDNVEIDITVDPGDNPPPVSPDTNSTFVGTKLGGCDLDAYNRDLSTDAADFNKSFVSKKNVSTPTGSLQQDNRENATNSNTLKRLGVVVTATDRSGDPVDLGDSNLTHPLIVSYTQQVVGDYELGDGSADIPDPDHRDALFVGISYDNGSTWKNTQLSHSEEGTSISVEWNGATIPYYGHVQKPSMAIQGNNILIAYNDKFCPSRNPLELDQNTTTLKFDTDYFDTVGNQGTIDYEGIEAPNGKFVYEAPYSCVWTVRGIFKDDVDGEGNYGIEWHKPMQLTSGMRDSNHIKIAASKAGFALAWQEDKEGLRSGKGAGPGEGWSGATTNHGTDIWYSSIKMVDFNDSTGIDNNISSVNNFLYPVRITDNEICQPGDTKLYCQQICEIGTVTLTTTTNNNKTDEVTRCYTHDTDWLLTGSPLALPDLNDTAVLDGDTGASRPAIEILETDVEGEYIVILGYEETKGLSLSQAMSQDQDKGDSSTDIEVEGKSVYFESFRFDAIDAFDPEDNQTMFKVAMPLVSAGDIVNIRVPEVEDPYAVDPVETGDMIYENARRLVIGTQVDACDAENYTFAFLYKQSFDTQGASSDMYVKVNNGFTYDSFTTLNDGYGNDLNVTNVSAQNPDLTEDTYAGGAGSYIDPDWDPAYLQHQTYANNIENTFSPRIFLRGDDIYTGFAYTPDDARTVAGHMPTNFHTNIYMGGKWAGPENVSKIIQGGITSEDPRFIPTPKALNNTLPSDASNPNILWVAWGTIDVTADAPEGIYFKRADYNGTNWNWDENKTKLADMDGAVVHEHAVQVLATPDGKTLHSVWIQEVEEADYDPNTPYHGLDTWYGRVDINETE